MKNTVDAIIFDFGGVLINLDYRRTVNALSALRREGLPPLDYRKRTDLTFFDDYETGSISTEAFRTALRAHLELDGTDAALDAAWNAMILDLPDERIRFLEALSQEKRIFLLSNTNALHEAHFKARLKASGQYEPLLAPFEAVYFSHHLRLRKPNPEIFHYVVRKHELDPGRTLFIDDTQAHTKGAAQAGLRTRHLHYGKETILEVLR